MSCNFNKTIEFVTFELIVDELIIRCESRECWYSLLNFKERRV